MAVEIFLDQISTKDMWPNHRIKPTTWIPAGQTQFHKQAFLFKVMAYTICKNTYNFLYPNSNLHVYETILFKCRTCLFITVKVNRMTRSAKCYSKRFRSPKRFLTKYRARCWFEPFQWKVTVCICHSFMSHVLLGYSSLKIRKSHPTWKKALAYFRKYLCPCGVLAISQPGGSGCSSTRSQECCRTWCGGGGAVLNGVCCNWAGDECALRWLMGPVMGGVLV